MTDKVYTYILDIRRVTLLIENRKTCEEMVNRQFHRRANSSGQWTYEEVTGFPINLRRAVAHPTPPPCTIRVLLHSLSIHEPEQPSVICSGHSSQLGKQEMNGRSNNSYLECWTHCFFQKVGLYIEVTHWSVLSSDLIYLHVLSGLPLYCFHGKVYTDPLSAQKALHWFLKQECAVQLKFWLRKKVKKTN